jgi:nucleoid-associated protein YgaU
MDDGRTEPFEPYQPETSYDWDYEEEPPRGGTPKILWGRIIAVAVVFLLGLLIGRALGGGGDGVSQESYDAVKKRVSTLEQQLAAARAEAENPPQDDSTPVADDPTESASPAPPADTKTYVVKQGDTLRGIAEKFYDDASLDDLIAEANGITDATQLSVGRELTIPPKP